MFELNSTEWAKLEGGYRQPYDASTLLKSLAKSSEPTEAFWNEAWNNLYHQRDVGLASYAAIPWLLNIYRKKGWIDYQLPNFAFAVEQARLMGHNPAIPESWAAEYRESIEGINNYCIRRRSDCGDPEFRKAVVMLTAVIVGATDIAELVDFVEIGDEQRVIEIYSTS